ncbi:glycosyl hydrolase family 76 protein [Coccidioides immitis RS]|uniref:Mannan endo-1,6-alpha-mannosidase n=3 Tax=Coccidioides immitis TaxID=5501 RepID=A0A0E1RZZ1_COCIM|nr:glycosyl hydrolase family 76 protein [Coccidioides immitis RS]EAS27478.1 glycosyl hydrolase family 76 protein [Coccidioides immitis RS]KMP09436.1 mannan endo-1,6-alpha-mannosidase DCW1 [Coccidioides immitis RMSCC 2394]KMU75368.1 mannan endo-1,6-alpha-mannosidase DCW1 [Coccidioides immitis RMSCC 3703]TPX20255.1 hydrolase 76 protein [Coccidioides immitis]
MILPSLFSNQPGPSCSALFLTVLLGVQAVHAAIPLDLGSPGSIKSAAKQIAGGMVKYYTGYKPGDVPGNLPDPYYWWEAGAMFSALIDYWYYTGDDQYNDITTQAMLHQVGKENNYMPLNQTSTLGNDDQAFWGMAAMSAAENKFPNPPDDKPQWLELAQAVLHSQVPRWDDETCGGGLRWQIFSFNKGYNYKNSISNGCFINLAARLALYTKNETYVELAEKHWDWMTAIGLISPTSQVFDGSDVVKNCSELSHIQWTYNNGVLMGGAAALYNFTKGADIWEKRLNGLIDAAGIFFSKDPPDVMTEVACEGNGKCNIDQRSFKAYLSRWMAMTIKLAPYTRDRLLPKLQASATAAALQCSGPDNACGLRWTKGEAYDGSTGVGEQMAALEIIQSNLIDLVAGPADNSTGISRGNPSAGTGSDPTFELSDITTGDRVGAGFLTSVVLIGILGGAWWMVS